MKENAWDQLSDVLDTDEELVAIVFGKPFLGLEPREGENWSLAIYKRGVVLPPGVARPAMQDWKYGDDSACYAMYAWTTKNVIFVVSSGDRSETFLAKIPREPTRGFPRFIIRGGYVQSSR